MQSRTCLPLPPRADRNGGRLRLFGRFTLLCDGEVEHRQREKFATPEELPKTPEEGKEKEERKGDRRKAPRLPEFDQEGPGGDQDARDRWKEGLKR